MCLREQCVLVSNQCLSFSLKKEYHFSWDSFDYSCADWEGPYYQLEDVPWVDMSKLSVSVAAAEFLEWVKVRIEVYIPYHKD